MIATGSEYGKTGIKRIYGRRQKTVWHFSLQLIMVDGPDAGRRQE
jgi:hypothetical protein